MKCWFRTLLTCHHNVGFSLNSCQTPALLSFLNNNNKFEPQHTYLGTNNTSWAGGTSFSLETLKWIAKQY